MSTAVNRWNLFSQDLVKLIYNNYLDSNGDCIRWFRINSSYYRYFKNFEYKEINYNKIGYVKPGNGIIARVVVDTYTWAFKRIPDTVHSFDLRDWHPELVKFFPPRLTTLKLKTDRKVIKGPIPPTIKTLELNIQLHSGDDTNLNFTQVFLECPNVEHLTLKSCFRQRLNLPDGLKTLDISELRFKIVFAKAFPESLIHLKLPTTCGFGYGSDLKIPESLKSISIADYSWRDDLLDSPVTRFLPVIDHLYLTVYTYSQVGLTSLQDNATLAKKRSPHIRFTFEVHMCYQKTPKRTEIYHF